MNNRSTPDTQHQPIEPGYGIVLPCEPAQFGEFVSGLLGKPQTIEKCIFGALEITKDDAISTYWLIEQRLHHQNTATLVQFTARIVYDDDSSVLLNSLVDFEHYAEVRPLASVGVVLSWTYLITFRGKKVPEKQEINLSFQANRTDIDADRLDDDFLVKPSRHWRMPSHVLVRISHTERTWGIDIESLLTGHIKTLLKPAPRVARFINKNSGRIGLLSGGLFFAGSTLGVYFASNRFIEAYTQKLKSITTAAPSDAVSRKIDFLIEVISTGAWPRFTFAALAFLVLSLVASILIGTWISTKAESTPSSHVLLSKSAEERRRKITGKLRRDWLTFYVSLGASIFTGIISNVIFTRYFSTP
jgi:hypothetical protein